MAVVRNYDDLSRVAQGARARHEQLRAARREELVGLIEAAIDRGAEDVGTVLAGLSEREYAELVEIFPQLLTRLAPTDSAHELRAVIDGGRALLRSQVRARDPRDAVSVRLSRAALVTASVDPSRRPLLAKHIKEIDDAPGPRRLSRIWFRYRFAAALAFFAKAFSLKP